MKGEPAEVTSDRPIEPSSTDWRARVEALAPEIAAAADQIERDRRLPEPLVAALCEAGLFHLLLPRPLGGGEVDPAIYLEVVQAIAGIDASTAWCLSQTSVCAMVAAALRPEAARAIFRDRRSILAWGSGVGRAVVAEGGYRVTGSWPFASGGHHATWFGGHCTVHDRDGVPRRNGTGVLVVRTMLFPAQAATMTDAWDVIGLRGTGSDAYAVTDIFVPEAFSVARDDPAERRYQGALYRLRTDSLFACSFASVAFGLARRLLDEFIALAKEKSPRGHAQTLRENAAVQAEVGELEGRLRAARFHLMGALTEAWRSADQTKELTLEERMSIRLAATRTLQESKAVADAAYHAAGATAVFTRNPFERRFRDMHAVAQQLQARRSHFETVGKYLLGLSADTAFL